MTKHKASKIFLWILFAVNIGIDIFAQAKLIRGSDIVSVIPITMELSTTQILLLNIAVASIVITLISYILMVLVTDTRYSIGEVLSNCAGVFTIPSVIMLGVSIFSMVNTATIVDKISIIAFSVVFILLNIIIVGSILTIDEDERL